MSFRNAFYYDNRSNLTCVLDPQNGLTYYTYDAANRMTSVKNPWGEVTTYDYSPGGRLLKRVLGNGCVTYYSYDATGQTSKVENLKSDLSVISSFEYARDRRGNPLSIVREDGYTTYYEYDAKSQLIGELQRDGQGQDVYAWTWDYDAAGNRTVQTFNGVATYYEYNAANELTREYTATEDTYYQYDRCGNTTVQQAPGGTTYYHWDHENLLTQIDLPGDVHNYFSYDADSKRVTKADSEGFTRFIYQGPDMLKLLQEQDEEEELVAHYTMGNGLEAMRREEVISFYHYDWLGSTFELTDADEVVTDEYLYNAWGEMLAWTGTTTENPHQYVGNERYHDVREAALYLLGLRHYKAQAGHMVSADPARALPNLYSYVGNRPTSTSDPLGLYGPDVHRDRTTTLALTTTVPAGSRHKGFDASAAAAIGEADVGVDVWYTLDSGWHFDYSGSRQKLHQKHFNLALRFDKQHNCVKAYRHLGMSLHPMQDVYGHGPAYGCDHTHYPNELWIDSVAVDTNWVVLRQEKWQAPWGLIPDAWVSGLYPKCWNRTVRVFASQPGSSRITACMADTESRLDAYLSAAQCCFKWR